MEEKYYTIKENEDVVDAELTFVENQIDQLRAFMVKAEYEFDTEEIERCKKEISELLMPYGYIKSVKLKKSRNL